jgi:uncharacterized protein YqgV (UPF0045/DUF77 family)
MRITAELSLYPIADDYLPYVKDFIDRLKSYKDLEITTNATSTQIVGEHSHVFEVLSKETEATFSSGQICVFVLKLLGVELDIQQGSTKEKSDNFILPALTDPVFS